MQTEALPAPHHPEPQPALDIVYTDDTLVVLDKPSGLLSVPGRGADKQMCLSAQVQARFSDALVVHRLDMATSGLMVMARGPAAQRILSQAFAQRHVVKRYEAVVHGEVTGTTDQAWRVIDLPIGIDWPNRPRRIIDFACGKPSTTRLQLTCFDAQRGISHVLLEPLTGRTHQLRLHLQAIGHAILGDALYASPQVLAMAPRLLLHACELSFTHPFSGQTMYFSRRRLKCTGEPNTKR